MGRIQLKRQEPVLDPNDPFFDDKLERRDLAKALTGLVSDTVEPLVVAMNGGWGTGKTFFLKRWACSVEKLKKDNGEAPCVIYFDAWQDDDLEDPLLALVGQIHRKLHVRSDWKPANIKEDIESKADRFYVSANKVLTKAVVHLSHVVEHFSGADPAEIIKDFSNLLARQVERYSGAVEARADLRNRLVELSSAIWTNTGMPLIVVIDDLDRCRPAFAIALLERVKHLFDVQHVVFVLGIDVAQFVNSLTNVYGERFDANNYLHRLVDVEFLLPAPNRKAFFAMLFEQYKVEEYLKVVGNRNVEPYLAAVSEFKSAVVCLSNVFQLSLREMERVVRELVAIERLHPFYSAVIGTLIAISVLLRNRRPVVYEGFVNGTMSPKEVVDALFPRTLAKDEVKTAAVHHIVAVVYSSYKNTQYGKAINALAQSVPLFPARKDEMPVALIGALQWIGSIVELANNLVVNHENVIQIANAQRYFMNWHESEW